MSRRVRLADSAPNRTAWHAPSPPRAWYAYMGSLLVAAGLACIASAALMLL